MITLRHDWSLQEIETIYASSLTELVFRAAEVHRAHHRADEVQGCMLLSIKTGGCPEDCAYCPQSARYDTEVGRQDLLQLDETLAAARRARDQGAPPMAASRAYWKW
jgi:biotin synthase